MHKWIISGLILVSVLASLLVIKFGLNPKPIPIIKASNFEEPEKFSLYIYRQLFPKLKMNRVLAFGSEEVTEYNDKLIHHLARLLSQEQNKTINFITDREFLGFNESMSSLVFNKIPKGATVEEVAAKINPEFLNILVFGNQDVLHKFQESLVNKLEFQIKGEILSFAGWSLEGVSADNELHPCENTEDFPVWVGCLKQNKARQMKLSKKINPQQTVGFLERISEKDFFIFVKR